MSDDLWLGTDLRRDAALVFVAEVDEVIRQHGGWLAAFTTIKNSDGE